MSWTRLKESETEESTSMLPARVALDYDEAAGTYWTYLESFTANGEARIHYGQTFQTEAEAMEDFRKRVERL